MNRTAYTFMVFIFTFVAYSNGLNLNGDKNQIAQAVSNELRKCLSRDGIMDIEKIQGNITLMKRITPYEMSKGNMKDFRSVSIDGAEINDNSVELQWKLPNVYIYFQKFSGSVIIFPVNLNKVKVKTDAIKLRINLDVKEDLDQCALLVKNVKTELIGIGDLDLQGLPNIPIVRNAKQQVVNQMPKKLDQIFMKALTNPISIPCNLF